MADKQSLENNAWLNDKHINAVQQLISTQYKQINGFQDTRLTPFFIEKVQIWNTNKKIKFQQAPCAQIHFDGNSHWVSSFSTEQGVVYYMDSLGENLKHLKFNIQIQLSQIYTHKNIQVKIPRIHQQPNSHDCGLFAIANTVEFCENPSNLNFNYTFSVDKMRPHLVSCLENGQIKPFPKDKSTTRSSAFTGIPKIIKMGDRRCQCGMPDFVQNMVGCESRKCSKWFHFKCVGIKTISKPIPWQCPSCNYEHS